MEKEDQTELASPQIISSEQLDLMLEQYYLKTDTPTLEYVYSLCALGAHHHLMNYSLILEAIYNSRSNY